MKRAWSCPARLCALLATLALVVLSFGLAAPASADASDVDRGKSEAAHQTNAERKSGSGSASTTQATTTTGGDDAAADKGGGQGSSSSTSAKARGHSKKKDSTSTTSSSSTGGSAGTSLGEQPVSNADQNEGGANGQCFDDKEDAGYFCGTERDEMSGNGQGKAPHIAGSRGKADNKNPPGQSENDRNNGYECDGNKGIAKGNPAHTGCVTPPTVSEECPQSHPYFENGCVPPEPECVPTPANDFCGEGEPECVPTPANDFCDEEESTPPGEDGGPPPVIGGEEEFGAPRPPTVAGVQQFAGPPPAAAPAAAPQAGVLPQTGAAALTGALATLAVGLLLVGGALIGMRRRGAVAAGR